jgi:hypothetical protein
MRLSLFCGSDMGDLLGEMSTERAIEMVRHLDEVQVMSHVSYSHIAHA